MRVTIAGLVLESVSFLPLLTEIEDFRRSECVGDDVIARYRGTNTTMGGFIKGLSDAGVEIVPILIAGGWAAGSASDAAFVHYVDRICAGLAKAGKFDGVLLHPHGAMTTPTRLDPDREMVERVRAVIGRDTPLVVALDYHGNIDEAWLKVATAIFGYHYSPHIDMAETGERAARCLVMTLKGEMKPVMAIAKPGVMVPSIFSATGMAPLSDIVAESVAMPSKVDKLVDVSVFAGFSYADVPNCGFAVAAVANDDAEVAAKAAEHLSMRIRAKRQALMHDDLVLSLQDGLDRASARAKETSKPIVILEHADRENDSTYVLREVIRRKLKKVAVPYLCDPQAAMSAARAGEGAEVTLEVGGRSSDRAGGPVTLKGRILFVGDKIYRGTGAVRKDNLINLGLCAVIDADGVVVIITSSKNTAVDLDPFVQFGLKFEDFDIIVLRSKTHFRAAYEPLAEEIIIVDTPDWGPADLSTLPYRHVPVDRIFPFCSGNPGTDMHHSRLCAVLIDCNTSDVDKAARFWAAALGRPVDPAHPGSRGNYRMLQTPPDEPIVQIQRVDHESRVHIDIEADDIAAEVARLESLGAEVMNRMERWVVMLAPTGQRFCVVRVQRPGFPKNANRWG